LKLSPPKTKRQLRHFLGMVNYYRDMWRKRSHVLAPLTGLVSPNVKFIWGKEQQEAFEEIKHKVSQETLLAFPDFEKEFHIYTDASNKQLGAVIMQEGKPLAFYSRKMKDAQTRYTTGEQELLSIVETLKEFRDILLGQNIIVHTDHLNILYGKLSNDRITRWRLLLEEYGPKYVHIAGKNNVVADALSRLEKDDIDNLSEVEEGLVMSHAICALEINEARIMPRNKLELVKDIMHVKDMEEEEFPMSPAIIAREQTQDKKLKELMKKTDKFSEKQLERSTVIMYEDKIFIPESLRYRIVWWYHTYLQHPGQTRMEATLRQHFVWPNLRKDVESMVKTCHKCQLNKRVRKKYGELPEKVAEKPIAWNRVDVDLIGPLTIKTPRGKLQLRALTMIDPATNWFEVKDVKDKSANEAMIAFDDVWLSRYPRPEYIGFDNGGEYKDVFNELIINYGLKPKNSTPYNPQSNGIIERVHLTLTDSLRTAEIDGRDLDEKDPFGPFLASAAYAIRSTFHTTLKATPAQLVFGRDMILPIKFKADWAAIEQTRQKEISRNNKRENASRMNHQYKVGDKILLKKPGMNLRKLETPRTGPHTVTAVFTNGTIRIQRNNVSERVNIRRVCPYFEDSGH